MSRGRASRWRKAGRIALAVVALPLALLVGAGALLGLVPANAGWVQAERGVTIFVHSNGVHTSLVLPLRNEVIDWRPLLPPADLRVPAETDYVMFGYGHRGFYLDTPSWAELDAGTAVEAAMGQGDAVMHVDHLQAPHAGPELRALVLTPDQYRRLAGYVRGHFRFDGAGRTIVLAGRGYGDADAFYEAQGGFSAVFNCNEWTGRALRAAGVRMGLWTPLAMSVMARLP
jgi:uncharacterized protein (TIGR02117 family)